MRDEASLTSLLRDWNRGDTQAAERILPIVYEELRTIAHAYFRHERNDHTLQATAIVHEAYCQLFAQAGIQWRDRSHLVGFLAHVMRRVLVDYTRQYNAEKRGGGRRPFGLLEVGDIGRERQPDLVELDEALMELEMNDPQKAAIVELRFFGGLTLEEIALCLDLPHDAVVRQWRRAKNWLFLALSNS